MFLSLSLLAVNILRITRYHAAERVANNGVVRTDRLSPRTGGVAVVSHAQPWLVKLSNEHVPMSLQITEMLEADLPEVLKLWDSIEGVGLNESDTPDRLALYLRRNRGLSLVARDGGRVIGAVLCGHDGRRGYLHHLAVASPLRGQGLGRRLVEQCISLLAANGIQKCNIFVYADNDTGSAFWRKASWLDRGDLKIMQRVIDTRGDMDDAPKSSGTALPVDLSGDFINSAINSFRANKGWADKAIAQVPDDKLHVALDANTNSIAVIMKHVAGNLHSRWTDFLTTDGEKPWRNRDDEFVDAFHDRAEVLDCWERGWLRLFDTLESLQPDDLAKTITIRGEAHSVPLAVHRSLAHCGYHVGQIILIARLLAGDDWETITIPRGGSAQHNQNVWGQGGYGDAARQRPKTS